MNDYLARIRELEERLLRLQAEQAANQVVRPPVIVQPTTSRTDYVTVPTTTKRQLALEEAMKRYARDFPGSASTIDAIEHLARQIESGMRS